MRNLGENRRSPLSSFLFILALAIPALSCTSRIHLTPICQIQGNGAISPYFGKEVKVRGIVTADLEGQNPKGFYLQDESCLDDYDKRGSKGIFILEESGYDLVSRGDVVSLRGMVLEYNQETILSPDLDSIKILSIDNPLPTVVEGEYIWESMGTNGNYEKWEGMLVLIHKANVVALEENNGKIWILPETGGRLDQANASRDSSYHLWIFSSSSSQRFSMIKVGDTLENLKGIIRQAGSEYILHILDPVQISIRPSTILAPDLSVLDSNGEDEIEQMDPSATGTGILETTPTYYPVELLLVEIFPNPQGDEPEGEWIEIYNPSPFGLPLTGIKIGDDPDQTGKEGLMLFPPGYQIEAGEVLVIANQGHSFRKVYGFYPDFEMVDSDPIIPDMLPYLISGGGSIQLSNGGDEVVLLDPWDGIVDGVSYGNSSYRGFGSPVLAPGEGNSLERYPPERDRDKPEDWRERRYVSPGKLDYTKPTPRPSSTSQPIISSTPSPEPTFTSSPMIPTPTPVRVQLLITEIMFNPVGAEPEGEWFEVYNPTDATLPLSNVKIGDAAIRDDPEGMYVFPEGESILAGDFVLVANRADVFKDRYGFNPDYELSDSDPGVLELTSYSGWASGSIRLGNEGDELVMLNGWDEIIDLLAYGGSNYDLFQPPIPLGSEGASLARCPLAADTDSSLDWIVLEDPSPGSGKHCTPTITPSLTMPTTLTPSLTMSSTLADTSTPPFGMTLTSTYTPTMACSDTPSCTSTITPTQSLPPSPQPTITPHISTSPTTTLSPTSTPRPQTPTLGVIEDPVIILNEIHADPHPEYGDANGDGEIDSDDDEFLEIVNVGEDPIDLSGWSISDAIRVRYVFPSNTTLAGKGAAVVFGGGNPVGEFGGSLVFSCGSLGLNNKGDTIFLRDNEGELRIEHVFGVEANQDQSLTRDPDLVGIPPFIIHSQASSSGGSLYSPGTRTDGTQFEE